MASLGMDFPLEDELDQELDGLADLGGLSGMASPAYGCSPLIGILSPGHSPLIPLLGTASTASSSEGEGNATTAQYGTSRIPIAADTENYLPGLGHPADNQETNVTAAAEAAARNYAHEGGAAAPQQQSQRLQMRSSQQSIDPTTETPPPDQQSTAAFSAAAAAPLPVARRPSTPHEQGRSAAPPVFAYAAASTPKTSSATVSEAARRTNVSAEAQAEIDAVFNTYTNRAINLGLNAQFTANPPLPIAKLFLFTLTAIVGLSPTIPTRELMTNIHGAMVVFLMYGWKHQAHIQQMILDHASKLNVTAAYVLYHTIIMTKQLIFRRQNFFSSCTSWPLLFGNEPTDDRDKRCKAVLPLAAMLAQAAFWMWSVADGPAKFQQLLNTPMPIEDLLDLLFVMIRSTDADWFIKEKLTFPARITGSVTNFLNAGSSRGERKSDGDRDQCNKSRTVKKIVRRMFYCM